MYCRPYRGNVGEGTLRVVELVESQDVGLITCEGGGNVVGVVTPLGEVAQALHGDQVVELRVQLGVQDEEGNDREEQKEVERVRGAKEVRSWMTMEIMMRLRT